MIALDRPAACVALRKEWSGCVGDEFVDENTVEKEEEIMLLGLLGDSHDRMSHLEAAVKVFNGEKVDRVLHAGDYVAPFALSPLEGLKVPWEGVFGNNDGEREGLSKVSEGRIQGVRLERDFGGRRVVLVHEQEQALDAEGKLPPVDMVICAHTHVFHVERVRGVWVVNPGECCGYLSMRGTVAILDTDDLSVTRVVLEP